MEDGIGLADMILLAVIHGAVQHLGAIIVEKMRDREEIEHPLDEPLRALAMVAQDELPRIRKALEEKETTPPKRTRR